MNRRLNQVNIESTPLVSDRRSIQNRIRAAASAHAPTLVAAPNSSLRRDDPSCSRGWVSHLSLDTDIPGVYFSREALWHNPSRHVQNFLLAPIPLGKALSNFHGF
jgi:hypothetical protein